DGGVTLLHRGGDPPRGADRLQHETFVSVSPRANYARSYQQFSLAPMRGQENRLSQTAQLRYRFDASSSRPPTSYSYRAEAVHAGSDENRSRLSRGPMPAPRSPEGITFLFGSTNAPGPLGTETQAQAPPAFLTVKLEEALTYGLSTPSDSMITFHQSAFREWNAVYRVLKPGEGAPQWPPAPPSAGPCVPPSLGGSPAEVSTTAIPTPIAAPIAVPDVRGRPGAGAAAALRAAGLQVKPRIGPAAPRPEMENTVAGQSPEPGSRAEPGSPIEIVLHGPPAPALAAPDLSGLTAADAKAALERAGLRIRPSIGAAAPDAARAHRVQSQEPAAGASLSAGAEVHVVLFGAASAGPAAATPGLPPLRPRPPSRTFQCPPAAGGWRNVNAQAVSQPGPGRMSAVCYYGQQGKPQTTLTLHYVERGYFTFADGCDSSDRDGRYIRVYLGEDTRGLDDQQMRAVLGWGFANRDQLNRELSDVAGPGLASQAIAFADSCSAPPPPLIACEDSPLCAVACPSIPGFTADRPAAVPRQVWSSAGQSIDLRCGYRGTGRNFVLFAAMDLDAAGVAPPGTAGKCGSGTVKVITGFGQATLQGVSASKRANVRSITFAPERQQAMSEAALQLLRLVEVRSTLPCIP
ncbi:MAG TPA: hypothetical protein DEH78_23145, partial [Solibacterales bacterium]|nr:hypothetical protein [Bryobacterales bacterium]